MFVHMCVLASTECTTETDSTRNTGVNALEFGINIKSQIKYPDLSMLGFVWISNNVTWCHHSVNWNNCPTFISIRANQYQITYMFSLIFSVCIYKVNSLFFFFLPKLSFFWNLILIQACLSTALGPHAPRAPEPPQTYLYLLLCNLIKCKFVWEYAQIRHSINWTGGASFFSPSNPLLSSLASLLCRNSGLVTQQLFLL